MTKIRSFESLVSKFQKVVYSKNYDLEFDYVNEVIHVVPSVGCPVCNDLLDDVAMLRSFYPNIGYYCSVFKGELKLVVYLMFK